MRWAACAKRFGTGFPLIVRAGVWREGAEAAAVDLGCVNEHAAKLATGKRGPDNRVTMPTPIAPRSRILAMTKRLLLACALLFTTSIPAWAADAPCQVQVVLFVPADVQPPLAYQRRIDEIVDYAEAFFQREFKRWDIQQTVMPFRRSADGGVEVTLMRGKQPAADYKAVSVRAEVMDANRQQNKLAGGRQVWWIMVYAGEPPA
jgi:hypothetical protein